MKHSKEFYKKIFTKLYISYGHHPFPKEFIEKDMDIVLKTWDSILGDYKEEHILKGLDNAILESSDKMPRLPKLAQCADYIRSMERQKSYHEGINAKTEVKAPKLTEEQKRQQCLKIDDILRKVRGNND